MIIGRGGKRRLWLERRFRVKVTFARAGYESIVTFAGDTLISVEMARQHARGLYSRSLEFFPTDKLRQTLTSFHRSLRNKRPKQVANASEKASSDSSSTSSTSDEIQISPAFSRNFVPFPRYW